MGLVHNENLGSESLMGLSGQKHCPYDCIFCCSRNEHTVNVLSQEEGNIGSLWISPDSICVPLADPAMGPSAMRNLSCVRNYTVRPESPSDDLGDL